MKPLTHLTLPLYLRKRSVCVCQSGERLTLRQQPSCQRRGRAGRHPARCIVAETRIMSDQLSTRETQLTPCSMMTKSNASTISFSYESSMSPPFCDTSVYTNRPMQVRLTFRPIARPMSCAVFDRNCRYLTCSASAGQNQMQNRSAGLSYQS